MRIVPYRKVSDLDVLLKNFTHSAEGKAENRAKNKDQIYFIVPSRRDRDWWKIRAGLLEHGLETEPSVHLWNWEDLYGDICSFLKIPALRQIDPPDHRLILSHIVRNFLKEHKDGPGMLESWPGLARSGFIEILSDDIRELINEAVSPSQLSVTISDNPTSQVLPWLYERYLAYLREHRLMDSAQIPLVSLELLESAAEIWPKDKNFVFVGFLSFTHGQVALLNKLEALSHGGLTILQPATELENFQDATQQLEGKTWEDAPPLTQGKVISLRSSDTGLEAEMMARYLALWSAGKGVLSSEGENTFPGFGAIGMSVPAERAASMEAALRRYHIPYSHARGRSIAESSAGTVLTLLWTSWLQGLEAYETALLLSQPYFAGSDFSIFSIDDAVRAGPRGVKAWGEYLGAKAPRSGKAFKSIVKFCRTVENGVSPADLLRAFHAFLTTPGLWLDALANFSINSPDLDENLRELAASVTEVQAKYLALRELQPDIGDAGKIILKGREAVDFLKNWCDDTRVQSSPPLEGAVALYTGPPPILASYPVWIMVDVTQKNWPGVIRSSPLLDATEREAMRSASAYLPSIHDKRMQKEALFRRLMQTGDVLTVTTRSAVDEDGRPVGDTSFMATFIDDMKYWEYIEAPVTGFSELTPGGSEWRFPAIEAEPLERRDRSIPVARTSTEKEKFRLPVSSLYELLDCPLRYWLKRNAKLKERQIALFSDIDAGNITHTIWEAVWRCKQNEDRPIRSLASSEWRKLLSSEGAYAKFGHLITDRRLARHVKNMEFYIMRLADFQQSILGRLTEVGFRHISFETEMELPPYEIDGIIFTGRCDRVEILTGNRAVITDYKWGRSASYEKKLVGLNSRRYLATERESFKYGLQLSAYCLMYASTHPNHNVAGVGFFGHRDGGIAGSFEPPIAECFLDSSSSGKKSTPDMTILEERTAEALEAMKLAAAILKSKKYEPSYSADACRYCDVKGVCRKGELRGENLIPSEEIEAED